ncbi:MAG: DUF72 domain-containing protein [Actinomycetota bacterium]
MAARLHVGTSGFAYREWRSGFYPEKLPRRDMLPFYASVFGSVEINYSFRRFPDESVLASWRSVAPEGFRFTLKAPARITHVRRLADAQEEVDEFIRRARLLGRRLGAILFQLPPTFRADLERLDSFLAGLPPAAHYAMEFRHDSWGDPAIDELLAAHGVARCGVDADAAALGEVPVTAGHVYLRLRRDDYSAAEIAAWAVRIEAVLERGKEVYCYLKHDLGSEAPARAQALQAAIG